MPLNLQGEMWVVYTMYKHLLCCMGGVYKNDCTSSYSIYMGSVCVVTRKNVLLEKSTFPKTNQE